MKVKHEPRLFVCSDIHGYTEGLLQLLDYVNYNAAYDQLYLLGDYIDHHPSTFASLQTIKDLVDKGAHAILGNFELRLQSEEWRQKAINVGLNSELLTFAQQLPAYYEVDHFLFVHAGIRPGIELCNQSLKDLTEIRAPFLFADDHEWKKRYRSIVFGHTPTFKLGNKLGEVWWDGFRLGIDTGAKHGGRLTLVEVYKRIVISCKPIDFTHYEQFKMEHLV